MAPTKYKTLTVQEKVVLLAAYDKGKKLKDLATEFGIGYSTAAEIVKKREKIVALADKANGRVVKRDKKLKFENVNEAMAQWFRQMRALNVPLSGEVMKTKAKKFADAFGVQFEASNGWLDKFKIRLVYTKIT